MKNVVSILFVVLAASSVFASGAPKLHVSCSDAPRGKDVYFVDVVNYSKDKLVLEVWNANLSRFEIKAVLPYKKCRIQGVARSLQQQ